MKLYEFDPHTGKYLGSHDAQVDEWQTEIKGETCYIGEANAVWDEPPQQEGYTAYYIGGEWVLKADPTQAELNQKEAETAKAKLQTAALNAMMATLAGGDITAQQNEYQSTITALSDEVALLMPDAYPAWSGAGKKYKKDARITYNGVLYKVLQDHTSQETWTPEAAPSLFAKVLTAEGEILDWQQPDSTNPYMKGDKVKYNGKVYESLIDNNVWAPDAYPQGWQEVTA